MRILVVDDNRDAAVSTVVLVEMYGHVGEAAYSGQDALEIARAFDPEVVLLDLSMPGMNGFEACHRLRHLPGLSHLPVIALTGFNNDEFRQRAASCGFASYLVKPIVYQELEDALARIRQIPR